MSYIKDERELLSKPGDTILETIEHLKMSQVELADRMGRTPSKINDIISGKEPITITTAMQLEKVLGIDAKFWLNREMIYREKLSRIEQEEALQECTEWLKQQPTKELKKLGYLSKDKSGTALIDECLHFFSVASVPQWEKIYVDQLATTSFRKSDRYKTALGSIAAWFRIGEVEMRKLNLPTFDKDRFKSSLDHILQLVYDFPEDYATQLRDICQSAGVAVIFTISFPNAPISGATRWFGGNPLIQLTDRFKTNDQFWFTFYHEAAHILLHGKKEIYIEALEGYVLDQEKEADDFAAKKLIPNNCVNNLSSSLTIKAIRQTAVKCKTHPGVLVGHLQHQKLVPYTFGNELKVKVNLDYVIYSNNEK